MILMRLSSLHERQIPLSDRWINRIEIIAKTRLKDLRNIRESDTSSIFYFLFFSFCPLVNNYAIDRPTLTCWNSNENISNRPTLEYYCFRPECPLGHSINDKDDLVTRVFGILKIHFWHGKSIETCV